MLEAAYTTEDWLSWGFTLSPEPLSHTGRFHAAHCRRELVIALVNVDGYDEYTIICFDCSKLWRTGRKYVPAGTKHQIANRELIKLASEWTRGWATAGSRQLRLIP